MEQIFYLCCYNWSTKKIDDGIIVLKNTNGQKIDKIRKLVIKAFKDVAFKIKAETNMKIYDILEVTLNLSKRTYSPLKKPNDKILYINTLSNHPPQIFKHLPTSINERLSKNLPNEEISNKLEPDYEKALKDSSFKSTKLKYKKTAEL